MAIVQVSRSVLVHVWGHYGIYEGNKVQGAPPPSRPIGSDTPPALDTHCAQRHGDRMPIGADLLIDLNPEQQETRGQADECP